jgi:hypothetical protein
MRDVILVAIVAAFFLVTATVVWACRRISADAVVETESETAFGGTHRRPLTDS